MTVYYVSMVDEEMEFFMYPDNKTLIQRHGCLEYAPGEKEALTMELAGRILVVDDNPNGRAVVQRILSCFGLAVETADNGLEACHRALTELKEGRPFDLILMDMHMPVMDGFAAAMYLRESGYTRRIAALTSNPHDAVREQCFTVGCDDYALKPIGYEMLFDLIKRNLEAGIPLRSAAASPKNAA